MTEDVPRSLLRRFAREQRARVLRLSNELVIASTELAAGADPRRNDELRGTSQSRRAVRDPPHPSLLRNDTFSREGRRVGASKRDDQPGATIKTQTGAGAPSAAPGLPSIVVVMVMVVAVLMIVVMVMMMIRLRQFHRALNGRGV
jgi:cobalamin biosynthesis Mg chelatase CobN